MDVVLVALGLLFIAKVATGFVYSAFLTWKRPEERDILHKCEMRAIGCAIAAALLLMAAK